MMTDKLGRQPDFAQGLRGVLLQSEPMSRHTSWRCGGAAEYFYTPADREDLVQLLSQIPEELPVHWVGLGSNLLVRDGGISGIVIRTSKGLNEIRILEGCRVYAESGVSCARVARVTTRAGLTGAEFLAGVPGSFGGALAMNAGAFGGETWDLVEKIDCVTRSGECTEIPHKEINYGYRSVDLPAGSWVLGGVLSLQQASPGYEGREKIRSLLEKRANSQPVQSANAGSVFRNPEGDYAARLIEESGLKGSGIGNAQISEVHANFIVNRGGAKASEIEELIARVQEKVSERTGIRLELEVRILGERL